MILMINMNDDKFLLLRRDGEWRSVVVILILIITKYRVLLLTNIFEGTIGLCVVTSILRK